MAQQPLSTKKGGKCFAVPNVCLTPAPPGPPAPVVYTSSAEVAAMNGAITTVLAENKETIAEGAKTPNSSDDQAGTNGGVTSGMNMGPVEPKTFSSKVYLQGKKAVFLTATTAHNGTNANAPMGKQISPSQTKVWVGS